MRYKKDPHKGVSMDLESNKENPLKVATRQLLTGEITAQQYNSILRENDINPNSEAINKIVRKHVAGNTARFDELFYAINKFQNDLDPTKIQIQSKHPQFNGETKAEQEKTKKSMIPDKNGNGLIYISQKRPVQSKYNYYESNKDLFDWEESIINKYKNDEFIRIDNDNNNNPRQKIVYESNIFKSDVTANTKENKKKNFNGIINHFQGSGDFLTWNGDVMNSGYWEKKEIKRKNPNEIRNELIQEKPTRKLNTMQIPSSENVLITNSLAVI